ncbi:hypothetical protein BG003_000452 [Podila horticola]|nr:hypothetical protein BG003_000452 [Podila horticola]
MHAKATQPQLWESRRLPYNIAPGSRTRTLSYADCIFSTQKLFISDGSLAVDDVLRRRESFYSLDPVSPLAGLEPRVDETGAAV